ncbi:hypothetical protein [Streptomyces sp. AgN23]|nr:hypothetical protein AS97_53365 [Streptomyces sp. AgN23]
MEDVSNDGQLLRLGERDADSVSPGQPSFEDHDVLFAKITPCMENGKGAYIEGLNGAVAYGSTEFHVLRARANVNAKFIHYWTRVREFRRKAESMMIGTGGQRRVPTEFFAKISVPSLPPAEQRRVAETLDAISESEKAIQASVKKLRATARALTDLLLSRLPWDSTLNDTLSGPPRNGHSPSATPEWTGIQMLGLGCLTTDGFQPTQLKNAPLSVDSRHPAMLSNGDLLMSRANTRHLVGLVGIYRDVGTPCIYPDLMMRLRVSAASSPEFLAIVLRSSPARRQIMNLSQGTSESMVKISSASARNIRIPLPSPAEQKQVVMAASQITQRIQDEQKKLTKLESLKRGIADDLLTGNVRFQKLQ